MPIKPFPSQGRGKARPSLILRVHSSVKDPEQKGMGERPGARVIRPPQRSASNLLSCSMLIRKNPRGSISLLCKTSFCPLKTGLGHWETGHPWEQRHSGGERRRWEKTQALPRVINHFIVRCMLGQGAGATRGEDGPPKCDHFKLQELRFSPRETETNLSMWFNSSSNR